MILFRRSATCALTVILVTLSCGLAARAQVGVPQRAPVAPIGVAPASAVGTVTTAPVMGAAPVKTAPVASAAPVKSVSGMEVNGVNTGLLLLIGQIADGQMTMDEAWSKGLLDAPKVLQLLSQTQRLTEDTRNETLLRDMAGLLVRFAPESIAKPEQLSARVRVALCRYYADEGDARTVPLCEALIAEKLDGKQIKQPLASNPDGGSSSLWLSSVITLAQYYENTGKGQKAGETWVRALKYWQDAKWWQSSIRIEAARAYTSVGQSEKAKTLYDQVPSIGDGWYTGLALWDQASILMANGNHRKALQLLQTPVSGEGTDMIEVVLSETIAESHYLNGNAKEAEKKSLDSLRTFKTLKTPRASVVEFAERSENILAWLDLWKKEPIIGLPRRLRPVKTPIGSIQARLSVRTWGDAPLTVTSDNASIQTLVEAEGQWSEFHFERGVLIRVAPNTPSGDIDAVLTVRSSKYPEFALKVPVHVEASENSPNAK